MRGLKVNIHHPARQHLAEGGMVHKIKGMLGLDPEKNARLQAYRDRAAAEKAAAASAPASSAAPAPAPKAVTDYNSGGAMKRREAAAGLADGGIVRGPGTGTSDSVPDELPEGSYVLPADTTQAVGQQTTAMLNQGKASAAPKGLRGAKVPVQLSKGEMKLMPEQVHAIGIDALEKMKAATHTPVAEQNQDQTRMFFANGGTVDENERRRQEARQQGSINWPYTAAEAGRSPYVAATPSPSVLDTDPQARADREAIVGAASSVADSIGNAGRAAADIATLPVRAVAGAVDSTAVRGLRAAGVNAPYLSPALVPNGVDPSSMTPFTDQKRMQQPAAAPAAVAQPVAAAPAPAVATAVPAAPAGLDGARPTGIPTAAPAAPQAQTVAPDIYRQGNSFGDSPEAAAAGAAPRGMPSAQNMAAADALAARSGSESAARVAAPTAPTRGIPGFTAPVVPNSTNSWQARNDLRNLEVSANSITNNGGRFDQTKGNNPAQAAYKAGLAADAVARGAQPTLDGEAMRQNGALQREGIQQQGGIDRETIQQEGANTRAARGLSVDRERLGIDRTRAQSEVTQRGVETAGAQQLQNLRNTLTDPNATPAQRKQATEALQALSGRQQQANRFTVVPGGQEWDATAGAMRNVPARVLDNRTGQFVQDQGAGGAQNGPAQPTSKAEYDALPKGAQYVKDGKILIKG